MLIVTRTVEKVTQIMDNWLGYLGNAKKEFKEEAADGRRERRRGRRRSSFEALLPARPTQVESEKEEGGTDSGCQAGATAPEGGAVCRGRR